MLRSRRERPQVNGRLLLGSGTIVRSSCALLAFASKNFRSIRYLDVELGETTVFIGPNNAGKTAILDAVRIVLTRRWGQRGTGFTEDDVHRPDETGDPRRLPPVTITMVLEEPQRGAWEADMVAALEDIAAILPDGRNLLTLRVTCSWDAETGKF
jgi:putative ATP-dependent endonuclease of OLD family